MLKRKQTIYLTSIYFFLMGHAFKKFNLIVAYFNNLSYNLTIFVNNLYRNLIN